MSSSIEETSRRRYGFTEISYCRDDSCCRDEKEHEELPLQRFRALTMTPSHYTDSDDEDEYYEDNGLWNQLVETLRKHERNGSQDTTLGLRTALKLMNTNSNPQIASCVAGPDCEKRNVRKKRKVMSSITSRRNGDLKAKDFENMHVFFGKQLLNVFDSEHGSAREQHYNAVQPLELGFSEALRFPRTSDVLPQQTQEKDEYLEAVQRYRRSSEKRQAGDKRKLNRVKCLLAYYQKLYCEYSYMPLAQAIGEEEAWCLAHVLLWTFDDTKIFLSIWECIVTLGLSPGHLWVLELLSFLSGELAAKLIRDRVLHRARTVTWSTVRMLIRELIQKLQVEVAREQKNFMDNVSPPTREPSCPGTRNVMQPSLSSSDDEVGTPNSIELLPERNSQPRVEVEFAFVNAKVYVKKKQKPESVFESPRSSSSSLSKITSLFFCNPENSMSGGEDEIGSECGYQNRIAWKVSPRSAPSLSSPTVKFFSKSHKMSKSIWSNRWQTSNYRANTVFANFHSKTPYDRSSCTLPPAPTPPCQAKKKRKHKKHKGLYLRPGTAMKISRPVVMIHRDRKKRFSELDLETVHDLYKRRIPEINLNVLPKVSPRDLLPGDIIFIYDYREQCGKEVQRISNCANADMDLQPLRTPYIHKNEFSKDNRGKPVPVKVRHVMVCTAGSSHSGVAQTAHVTLRRARMSSITTPVKPSEEEVRRKVSFMQMGMQEATLPLCYQAVVYRLSGFLSCSSSIAATAAKCIERSVVLPRVMDVDFVLTEPEHKDGFLKKSRRSLFRTAVREKFDKGISFVNLYAAEFMILCVHRAIYQLFKEKRSFESIHAILDIDPINPWPSISHSYMHDQKEWSLLGHLNFQFQ